MDPLNDFEKDLFSLPFTPDYWKARCNVLNLILYYINICHSNYKTYMSDDGNHMAFICELFGEIYFWLENIENGLVESSQLERSTNRYISKVLYANVPNAPAGAMLVMDLIEKGFMKEIKND